LDRPTDIEQLRHIHQQNPAEHLPDQLQELGAQSLRLERMIL
jgi:hypothetical protein